MLNRQARPTIRLPLRTHYRQVLNTTAPKHECGIRRNSLYSLLNLDRETEIRVDIFRYSRMKRAIVIGIREVALIPSKFRVSEEESRSE